ncbi:uncharacterized protein B0H18DRAFT_1038649 [Fomitopsis serialis]|uniref:uncharacterized protein n=1 Tax=Fomitopsis serialis TaxID=139415 RepID=UPI0020082029|nr:uncharacterized protein B0H18DRAFT_1038649 [Neoantrodia serialis]KAH9916334.1 hypothetical protein B0H18DRAFT_1038649 [Neoantrodia serialis]
MTETAPAHVCPTSASTYGYGARWYDIGQLAAHQYDVPKPGTTQPIEQDRDEQQPARHSARRAKAHRASARVGLLRKGTPRRHLTGLSANSLARALTRSPVLALTLSPARPPAIPLARRPPRLLSNSLSLPFAAVLLAHHLAISVVPHTCLPLTCYPPRRPAYPPFRLPAIPPACCPARPPSRLPMRILYLLWRICTRVGTCMGRAWDMHRYTCARPQVNDSCSTNL